MQKTYNYTAQAIGPRGFSVYLAFADTENGDGFSREQLNKRFISFVIATEEPPQSSFTIWTKYIGDSAYELAIKSGFIGTKAEWLTSLNGASHWNQIDGIPESFPAEEHDHNTLYDTKSEVDKKIADSKVASDLALTSTETSLNSRITTEVTTLNTRITDEVTALNGNIDGKIGGLKTELEQVILNSESTLNNRISNEVLTLNNVIGGKANQVHEHTQYDTILSVDDKIANAKTYADNSTLALKNSIDSQLLTTNNNLSTLDTRVTTELKTKENTITRSDASPLSPIIDDLWIDTSFVPNRFKRWSGTEWDIVGGTDEATTPLWQQFTATQTENTTNTFVIAGNHNTVALVVINGRIQRKDIDYTIAGNTLTLNTALSIDSVLGVLYMTAVVGSGNGADVSLEHDHDDLYFTKNAPLTITGSGTTSATKGLILNNSSNTEVLSFADNGDITMNGSKITAPGTITFSLKDGQPWNRVSISAESFISQSTDFTTLSVRTLFYHNGDFRSNNLINFYNNGANDYVPIKAKSVLAESFQKWNPVTSAYEELSGGSVETPLTLIGKGNTSTTSPFTVKNVDNINLFKIFDDSTVQLGSLTFDNKYHKKTGMNKISFGDSHLYLNLYQNDWSYLANSNQGHTIFGWNKDRVAIGFDGFTDQPSSILNVESTTKGMLLPRMTTAQRNGIVSPANGLFMYNTDALRFQYYNGSAWVDMSGLTIPPSTTEKVVTQTSSGVKADYTLTEFVVVATSTIINADYSSGTAYVTGTKGTRAYDIYYTYECFETNQWRRIPFGERVDLYLADVDDTAGQKTSEELNTLYPNAVTGQRVWGVATVYEKKNNEFWRKMAAVNA
jgi:hypothetical protein